jgi:glycosyltransferase involved in cell wall biosynthesis
LKNISQNLKINSNRSKKILFLSSNVGAFGGSEYLWCKTASYLKNKEYDVGVSIIKRKPEPSLIRTLRKSGCKIIYARRLFNQDIFNQIIEFSPKIAVISQSNSFQANDWMQTFLKNSIPYVNIIQCVHEAMWIFLNDQRILKFKELLEKSLRIFFVANENIKLTEKMIGARIENAELVRNPFKVNFDIENEWPKDDILRMAVVARLENFHKGHDLLFEVLKKEKWKKRDIVFHIFGEGPHREQMKRLVQLWEIPNIQFEGHIEDVENIWRNCHACVQPSRLEGMPLSVVEAMLCRRMVVATQVAGNSEIIVDGVNGFLAKAATVEFLDDALERAWKYRKSWKKMGVAAGRHIREIIPRNPVKIFADRLESIYNSIMKADGG